MSVPAGSIAAHSNFGLNVGLPPIGTTMQQAVHLELSATVSLHRNSSAAIFMGQKFDSRERCYESVNQLEKAMKTLKEKKMLPPEVAAEADEAG